MDTPNEEDGARYSRPTQIGPFGTMDAELKCAIDDHTLHAFDAKAHAAGLDRSKVLRNLAYLFAHGKSLDVLSAEAADRRMRLVLGEGLELADKITALHVIDPMRRAA
jgi:hypothetical protein